MISIAVVSKVNFVAHMLKGFVRDEPASTARWGKSPALGL
jgi:hypothetical protein